MQEKFIEIERYYARGQLGALCLVALHSIIKPSAFFDLEWIGIEFLMWVVMSFLFGGILYGYHLFKIKFTLNPIALIINVIITYIACCFFCISFFFIFIYYLTRSYIDKRKEKIIPT